MTWLIGFAGDDVSATTT